jgi:stage II sporulation protein M
MKRRVKIGGNESFGKQFSGALKYLRESGNYIGIIASIFLGGALLGIIFSGQLHFLDSILKELVGKIKDLGAFDTIMFILRNNLTASLYGLMLGILLGIFPVLTAASNGIILGYVMKGVWLDSGFANMWRILPHGVFEIPAVFISLALGLRLGMFIFSREKGKEFLFRAKNSMIIFVCIIIPLLVVAAIVEGMLIAAYK